MNIPTSNSQDQKNENRASFYGIAGSVLFLVLTIAGSLGQLHWTIDLLSHFRWYYFVIGAIGLLLICRSRQRTAQVCLGIAVLWNGWLLLPYYIDSSNPKVTNSTPRISLISANVFVDNKDKQSFVRYVRERNPDVVCVMEINPEWMTHIRELYDLYPHRLGRSQENAFGIGLLSKYPLIEPTIHQFASDDFPAITTKINISGKALQIVAVHPPPPVGKRRTNVRNEYLQKVGRFVKDSELPSAVVGDLNATPWSVGFQLVTTESKLRDSALGYGIRGTWNTASWIRIPIDHVLITPDVAVINRSIGPHIGSDHLPVEATLALP